MKKLIASLLLAFGLAAPAAHAADFTGVYFTPRLILGLSNIDLEASSGDSHDSSSHSRGNTGAALAIGYNFDRTSAVPIRTELEYMYLGDMKISDRLGFHGLSASTSLESQTIFANAYLDIYNMTNLVPYIGGGIGVAFLDMKPSISGAGFDLPLGSESERNFAWNVGFGCAYQINTNISLDLGYRYANLGKSKSKTFVFGSNPVGLQTQDDLTMHQLSLGLRVEF